MAPTVRRGVAVPTEADATLETAPASVSQDILDPTAASVVPRVTTGETVLRCVHVGRKDSATQRQGGVTAPLVQQDCPVNKCVQGAAMECSVGVSVLVQTEECVTL